MKQNKQRRSGSLGLVSLVFIVLLCAIFVLNLLLPDKTYSAAENRTLASRPAFSMSSLTNGTFTDEFETYASDQFAGRNAFRNVQIFFRWLGGAREENDVYLGKKGQLLEKIVVPDEALLAGNMSAINSFADSHPDLRIRMMLVPDAATLMPDSYPAFAEKNDQASFFQKTQGQLTPTVKWIDCLSALQENTEDKLYYKTDHHWTSEGAYTAYRAYCQASELTPASYTSYTVTDDFSGSLTRTSGFCMGERDQINIYVPQKQESLVLNYVDDQMRTTSIYHSESLTGGDPYEVFLGGNFSLIDITTTTDNDEVLLLFKDSFANSFVPFLTQHYSRIIMVDPRYYYGTTSELLNAYSITDVLFLYSGNSFFADNHLSGALE